MSDCLSALATACVRVSASSFVIEFRTCDCTVSGEIASAAPTLSFVMPSATRRKISH